MTEIIKFFKSHIKSLWCLGISDPKACLVIEIDALSIGYDNILKQKVQDHEQVVW
jgi:hypothetical protein